MDEWRIKTSELGTLQSHQLGDAPEFAGPTVALKAIPPIHTPHGPVPDSGPNPPLPCCRTELRPTIGWLLFAALQFRYRSVCSPDSASTDLIPTCFGCSLFAPPPQHLFPPSMPEACGNAGGRAGRAGLQQIQQMQAELQQED